MPDTTVRVEYIGAVQNFSEVTITGNQQVWRIGSSAFVETSRASQLVASGKFRSLANDPAMLPSTQSKIGAITSNGGVVGVNVPLVICLAQSAVPTILPSSGSSDNSGKITLTTALPYVPTGTVRIYLPAGVVVGDTTGGLKNVVFSDASTCNIVGATVTAGAAFTQSLAEQSLALFTVPGGLMTGSSSLRIAPKWSYLSNANNKTLYTKAGGSPIDGGALVTTGSGYCPTVQFANRGQKNRQITSMGNNARTSTTSVDTENDFQLALTAKLAVATDYIILESYTVEAVVYGLS